MNEAKKITCRCGASFTPPGPCPNCERMVHVVDVPNALGGLPPAGKTLSICDRCKSPLRLFFPDRMALQCVRCGRVTAIGISFTQGPDPVQPAPPIQQNQTSG